jgi:hypothetical protein
MANIPKEGMYNKNLWRMSRQSRQRPPVDGDLQDDDVLPLVVDAENPAKYSQKTQTRYVRSLIATQYRQA